MSRSRNDNDALWAPAPVLPLLQHIHTYIQYNTYIYEADEESAASSLRRRNSWVDNSCAPENKQPSEQQRYKVITISYSVFIPLIPPWFDRPTKLHPLLIGNSFPKHPRGSWKLGAQVKKSNYQKSLRLPASTSSPLLVSLIYIFDINFCSTKKQQQQQEENGGKKNTAKGAK